MGNILFYIIALLILAIIIVVHELGHFIVGRALGFKILEFAVGFGPQLIKWERNGIKYSIRLIPLGGACMFAGEDEDNKDDPRAMNNMPWYKRWAVLFSGAGFNIVFALIIGFVLFCTSGYSTAVIKDIDAGTPIAATQAVAGDTIVAVNGNKVTTSQSLSALLDDAAKQNGKAVITLSRNGEVFDVETDFYTDYRYDSQIQYEILSDNTVRIYSVSEKSNFYGMDIQKGDVVIAANGEKIKSANHLYEIISKTGDGELTLELKREDKQITVSGKLQKEPFSRIGVTLQYQNAPMPVGEAFITTITSSWNLCGDILNLLGDLVTGKADISMVTGPITTIGTMGGVVSQSAEGGFAAVMITILNLMWAISLNVAVFNLLPIPALDGARIVFVIIEAIRRKPINRELEAKIHAFGFMALILLVVVLEISKIFTGMGGTPVWM